MRRTAAALCVAALALLVPATAGAAPWTTAKLSGMAGKVFLLGVSCPTTDLCVASGTNNVIATSTDPTGGSAAWDFRYVGDGPWPNTDEWATQGISGKQIQGISCPSPRLCVAVMNQGNIYTSTDPTGPASAWNSIQIDDQGRNTHLFGVSCPTVSLCVAVSGKRADQGKIFSSTNPTGGLAAWRSTELAEPFEFRGVSCPTASFCVAVDDEGRIVTSTEPTGDGSAWRVVGAPGGPGSLQAISCVLTTLCVTGNEGGNLLASTNPTGALSSWDEFSGGGSVQITGVSCPSVAECLAVDNNGSVLRSTDPTGGRSAWSYENVIPYTPPPQGAYLEGNGLFAVSCPSSKLCVAAGTQGQIIAKSDPFADPPAQGKKTGKKGGKVRGPKRPRTKIATVRLPFGKALHEHRGRVKIRFYSVGRAQGFLCKFDKQRHFKPCSSPKRYPIDPGKHVFWVRATGMTGLKGPVAREGIYIPPFCKSSFGPPPSGRFLGTICTR
jgi:uncharacterized membrane protein